VVGAFLTLRLLRRLLRGCKARKLLRGFSSYVLLAPILLEGNLQYFFFLIFAQVENGFSLNLRDKGMTIVGYALHFAVLSSAVVSAFLAFYFHRKLAKYVLDHWRSRVDGLLAYSLMNVVRMLLFGAVHSLLRSHPVQLPLLLATETLFVAFLVSMRSLRAHKAAYKIWFAVCFALFRMVLLSVLIVQQKLSIVQTGIIEEDLLESVIEFMLIMYLLAFYIATAWELTFEISETLRSACA
jgi:hypothetical protein